MLENIWENSGTCYCLSHGCLVSEEHCAQELGRARLGGSFIIDLLFAGILLDG